MIAGSLGLRASKSSTTRGRPPVMSLVFVVSRGILTSVSPGKTSWPVRHHQVGARGQQVPLLPAVLAVDQDRRHALLVGRRLDDDLLRQAGDLVGLLADVLALDDVLELHLAADLGEDGGGEGVPGDQLGARLDLVALVHQELRAVGQGVALPLAALLVGDDELAAAVDDDQRAAPALDRVDVEELHHARVLGDVLRLLGHARRGAAVVEGTHGELRARLADRLRGDDAHRLADLDHLAGRQVAAVAEGADAAPGLAGEHGTDLHPLDARRLHGGAEHLGDLLADGEDQLAGHRIVDVLLADAADDAVAQRLEDLAALHDRRHDDAVDRAAVHLVDDDVLRHVDQTAGQVARVGRLERRVGEALAGAVRRDEVLQHREPLAEVRRDRRLDDLARGLGHQAAHAGELAHLLARAAGAGVGHQVDRVEDAGLASRSPASRGTSPRRPSRSPGARCR